MNEEMNKQSTNTTIVPSSEDKAGKIKGLIVLVTVLVIALLGLGGYVVYDKILSKETNSNEESSNDKIDSKTSQNISLSLDDELVQKLYIQKENGTNGYYFFKKSVTSNTMSDMQKHYYALQFLEPNDYKTTDLVEHGDAQKEVTISNEAYKKAIQRAFGMNVTYSTNNLHISKMFTDEPIPTSLVGSNGLVLDYSITNNQYEGIAGRCGDTVGFPKPFYYKLNKAYKNGDKVFIEEKFFTTDVLYNGEDKISYNVYADAEKTILIDSKELVPSEELESLSIDDYINKANTVKYEFELGDDGEYYFVSNKIEK